MLLFFFELLLLLIPFFIVATAGDFISVYLLSIFDPKFSLWGNIQARFWGNNILSVVFLTFAFMLARAVLEIKNPLRIGKIPAPLIAGATTGVYIEILGATTKVWGAAPDPWGLPVGLIVWPGGMFALLLWILWLAQRRAQ